MKERPILFKGAMVRAILAGTKTQTRRVVKPQPSSGAMWNTVVVAGHGGWVDGHGAPLRCPYGQPGDRLWVRESHWWFKDEPDHSCGYYPPKLTLEDVEYRADGDDGRKVWRPSIHMPRWASRITLEITSVRVERLHEISEADAAAEGMQYSTDHIGPWSGTGERWWDSARLAFKDLWLSITGPESWDANPWVWVVDFKRVEAKP